MINRLPSKIINHETPLKRLHGQDPDYTFLRTFGCAVWPNLRPYNSRKLEFRSKRCLFLGYSNSHKEFKYLDQAEGRIYISQDVVFDEQVFPFSSLRPNAGARLRAEIQLLPDILLNPSHRFGDASVRDRHLNAPVNPDNCSSAAVRSTEKISAPEDEQGDENLHSTAPYFMCTKGGGSSDLEVAPAVSAAGSDSASPSSSARQVSSSGHGGSEILPGGSSTVNSSPTPPTASHVASHSDPGEGGS